MPIYKPTELRLFLNELNIFPKKGLSQNFLIDGNIIRKIVSASQVTADDVIIEVGPGPGSLTQALLETGATVLAVEMDRILARELERLQTPNKHLTVFCQDILTFSTKEQLPSFLQEKKAKLIANLPYHLTTPILVQFCTQAAYFSSLTVMVQEEMARRMTALPGTKDYSSLTVFLRFYTEPTYAFTVSHHCFYPVPKVHSAVVVLKLKDQPSLPEKEAEIFFKMTRTAFEHRRKMLRASLKSLYVPAHVEAALEKIGESPLARPEALSLEQFLALYHLLHPKPENH